MEAAGGRELTGMKTDRMLSGIAGWRRPANGRLKNFATKLNDRRFYNRTTFKKLAGEESAGGGGVEPRRRGALRRVRTPVRIEARRTSDERNSCQEITIALLKPPPSLRGPGNIFIELYYRTRIKLREKSRKKRVEGQ